MSKAGMFPGLPRRCFLPIGMKVDSFSLRSCVSSSLVWAMFARRPEAFAFGAIPLGFYLMYSLATHMIPRYVTPIVPVMIVCLVVLTYVAATGLYRRWETKADETMAAAVVK